MLTKEQLAVQLARIDERIAHLSGSDKNVKSPGVLKKLKRRRINILAQLNA